MARSTYNRWWIAFSALGIHLCIGSVYAWSLFNPPLTRRLGVVASAAGDWTLSDVANVFTVAIVVLGITAALLGKWLEEVGPRMVGLLSAFAWGGGLVVAGLGVSTGQLWLLYLGYGVLGGIGLGAGYITPVSTLVRWFPDRRGMATGIAIMGFGGGAMIAKFMVGWLTDAFAKAPQLLGKVGEVTLGTEQGVRFAQVGSSKVEVLVHNAAVGDGLASGVYAVGTGSVGVSETFMLLGLIYFVVMAAAAWSYRVPPKGWMPEGFAPDTSKALVSDRDVHADAALKTPQFYQLWIVLCLNVAAGIGVLGVAKTMMTEIFGELEVVTSGFAATYVLMISLFNLLGRFGWASISDYIGRKNTYHIFFGLGIVLYLSIPLMAQQMSVAPSVTLLVGFYAVTMVIFTMYGGGFATIPAYIADIFGTRFVGAIHGRLLTAWSTAAVIGVAAITSLRKFSVDAAIRDLAAKVDPASFEAAFGASKEQLAELVAAKTVTIASLMNIAPAGTVDPTASLYNSTMILMAALLAIALVSNALMRPVDTRHHMQDSVDGGSLEPARA